MGIFDAQIKSLLKEENKKAKYLTYYHRTRNRPRARELLRVKSYLTEHLRNSNLAETDTNTYEKIINKVLRKLHQIENYKKGLAIFGKIEQGFEIEQIIALPRQPFREFYIGQEYYVDQLIHVNSLVDSALVLSIHRDGTKIYKTQDSEIEKLGELGNHFALPKEKETLEVYSPTRQDMAHYSTGGQKVQTREFKENKEHLRELSEKIIREIIPIKHNFNFLVAFYSSQYKDYVKKWAEKYHAQFGYPEMIFINKNYNDEKQIAQKSSKAISRRKLRITIQDLKRSKNASNLFITGLNEVHDAADYGLVDKVFAVVGKGKKYQKKAAKIMKLVAEKSGKVMVLSKNKVDFDIAAKLRYEV